MHTRFHGEKHGPFQWIFDTTIYSKSKHSRREFFDRLQPVKAIRCQPDFSLSWYVRQDDEWATWDVAWNVANKRNFDGIDFVTPHPFVFGLSFPAGLHAWLSSVGWVEVKDTVIQAMRSLYMESVELDRPCAIYGRKNEKVEIMERQIWRPIRDDICVEDGPVEEGLWLRNQFAEWRRECKELEGCNPPSQFDLQLELCYFRKDDWERVVEKGEIDALRRAEAREDVWEHWRYSYIKSGINLVDRKKRQGIPSKKRYQILKRDNFECQLCGANREDGARLEVDHKVPVSQGGTNNDENLWALCMNCNRGKGTQTVLP